MWHSKTIKEIYEELNSDENGLSSIEASRRLKIYGENKLIEDKNNILDYLKEILKNYFLWLFFIGFILSFVIHEFIDGFLIGIFILLYILFDIYDDFRVNNIIKSLEEKITTYVDVIRDGKKITIESKYLVPGDIVYLYYGNKVPADIRIIESDNLYVDESMITGESDPIKKYPDVLSEDTNIFNMHNMIFSGSIILNGYCKGIVVETGERTYIGKLYKKVGNIKRKKSLLEEDIDKFSKYITINTIIIIIVTFFLLYLYHIFNIYQAIIFSISLAILVVPEGLPSALLIILYYGIDRLKEKGILIKNPNILESLGYIDVIVTDKTGTITYSDYKVKSIYFDDNIYEYHEIDNRLDPILEALYNTATAKDIVDRSIINFLIDKHYKKEYRKLRVIPFDEKRKFSITIVDKNNRVIEYIKGVPEKLLEISDYIYISDRIVSIHQYKDKINKIIEDYSSQGYKVIGVGYKENNKIIFLGLVILENKLRENIMEYIEFLKKSNIDLIILSGDHKNSVEFIGEKLRIGDKALLGEELNKMDDKDLYENIIKYKLIARADPDLKLRIINVLKKFKRKVAMIGDGINDLLSLKRSDVGITFKDSTDAAKEVADIILINTSLSSIVDAIKEGKRDLYLIRIYIIVVVSILFGILFNILISFYVYRILFFSAIILLILNLIIETINSIIAVNGDILREDTLYKKIGTTIINKNFMFRIIRNGIFIGLDSLIVAFATAGSVFTIILFYIIATYVLFIYYGYKYGISYLRNKSFYISITLSILILIIFTVSPYGKILDLRFPPYYDYPILLMVILLFVGSKYVIYRTEKNVE